MEFDIRGPSKSGCGDLNFARALHNLYRESLIDEPILRSHHDVYQSCLGQNSIDDFIEITENKEITTFCKIAISHLISRSEKSSTVLKDKERANSQYSEIRENWITSLWRMISKNVKRSDIGKIFDGITFINFNYDRILEQQLLVLLETTYNLNFFESSEIIKRIKIFHPYGYIGPTKNFRSNNAEYYDFGTELSGKKLFNTASNLKTYSEQVESQLINKIRSSISNSDVVVFLGFGYHDQNIKLLAPQFGSIQYDREVYATFYNASDNAKERTSEVLRKRIEGEVVVYDGDIQAFLDAHRQSLVRY